MGKADSCDEMLSLLTTREGRLGDTSGGVDEIVSHDAILCLSPFKSQISSSCKHKGLVSPAGNWIAKSTCFFADFPGLFLFGLEPVAISVTSLLRLFTAVRKFCGVAGLEVSNLILEGPAIGLPFMCFSVCSGAAQY
jgi:hypothetical protein